MRRRPQRFVAPSQRERRAARLRRHAVGLARLAMAEDEADGLRARLFIPDEQFEGPSGVTPTVEAP